MTNLPPWPPLRQVVTTLWLWDVSHIHIHILHVLDVTGTRGVGDLDQINVLH